jgi:hypothetical protein
MLRKKACLRMSENRMLRKISGQNIGMLGKGEIARNESGHSRPEVTSRCMNHCTKHFPLNNRTTGSFYLDGIGHLACSHSELI